MTANDFFQVGLFLAVMLALVKPMGHYMALVFSDEPNRVNRFGARAERLLYRLSGIRAEEDMSWKRYAIAMLVFNVAGLAAVYILQRTQQWLPLNPQHFGAITPDSAVNTAISFATNTNWQGYAGESTMTVEEGIRLWREDPADDNAYRYLKYHLMVKHLLDDEKMSVDDLFTKSIDEGEVAARTFAALAVE